MKIKLICKQSNYEKYLNALKSGNFNLVDSEMDFILVENEYCLDVILGKLKDEIVFIKSEEILYFECFGNNIYCISIKDRYEVKEKLYELELLLLGKKFLRVNKSYVINTSKIKSIKPSFNMKFILVMENNFKIDVTRTYYYHFKEYFNL